MAGSPSTNDAQGYGSAARPSSTGGEFNALMFVIRQAMGKMRTATLVQVQAVTNSGGVSPVGSVDVQPLVNQLAGDNGVAMPQLFSLPYLRIQGGANAVIMDPEPGDIGLAVFAERDISSVKAAKQAANPGSLRMFDLADGLYIGGFLNAAPTQFIQFAPGGIHITSPSAVSVTAPVVNIGSDGETLQALVTQAMATLFNAHTHPVPGGTSGPTSTPMTTAQLTTTLKAG